MNQLEDMRLFVEVVDAGGFTAAADKLGLSKQLISKRIMTLEARLGVRLLVRTTRRLRATDLGLTFYENAKRIIQEVDDIERQIAPDSGAPRGTFRVSAPMSFGILHLGPLLPKFLLDYPEVAIELDLNDRAVDLIAEGYDMAVRIGTLPDSSLIARPIAQFEMVTCCSPEYRARRGRPLTTDDLRSHDCLLYGHGKQVEWLFAPQGKPKAVPVGGRLRANNGEMVRDAAIAGLGIVHLPGFIVDGAIADGRLVTVLDDCRPPVTMMHAVYPKHRQSSLLIRTFTEFMVRTFSRS